VVLGAAESEIPETAATIATAERSRLMSEFLSNASKPGA